MSRTAAKGKRGQPGRISREEMDQWVKEKGVVLRGGDLDEAPQAYRRLTDVLAEHGNTIRVLHTLRPLGVAMAGRDIRDPYKD
jgi:tRNA-splicing ligase RtcB